MSGNKFPTSQPALSSIATVAEAPPAGLGVAGHNLQMPMPVIQRADG